ncbi:pilus assembly protein [Ideonella livida]|uniref:PilY1 beta-propeller domain-containing protein n=1 Tax=Ideonella livida TaxID=2707176 RepID=A0A7C9TL31_9BURK|nr:PilC/PilY family type IV pilus protein [Ideonella livida]NDY91725.1 hypothetical protein [Ideonella livida]
MATPPGFGLVGALLLSSVSLAVEPSQRPLVVRSGEVPFPNVMITLDDSGSMLLDYMPEGNFKVNGYSLTLSNGLGNPVGFPGEPRYNTVTVPALKTGASAYQMQYRSPDVNVLWYNPAILYLPWSRSDKTGGNYGNAVATAAKWDPELLVPPAYPAYNLSPTGGKVTLNINWCEASDCYRGTKRRQDFYPGTYYRLKAGQDPTKTASYDRYDVNDTTGAHAASGIPPNRTDCNTSAEIAANKCNQAHELQNFANWFSYYRTREGLAKGALSQTLANFKDKMRAGFGRMNTSSSDFDWDTYTPRTLTVDGRTGYVVNLGIRPLDTDHLKRMQELIFTTVSFGNTPTRFALDEVGRYFKDRTDAYSPWLSTVGVPSSGKLRCRRSVSLLVSDGYWNASEPDGWVAPEDLDTSASPFDYSSSADNPYGFSPTQYLPVRPLVDGAGSAGTAVAGTLADVAAKYYREDLDASVENGIAPSDGDVAYWQHLTQYMVGLGVSGTLDASSATAKAETLRKIRLGDLNWPSPFSGSTSTRIDDMWHAAVVSGGDFYSVRNPTELSNALKDALGSAVGVLAKEAGVATTTSTLTAGNIKYVPRYKSVAWWGDVEAYSLDARGSVPTGSSPIWVASSSLPAHGSRALYTMGSAGPLQFKWAGAIQADAALVSATGLTENLVNYIRGDATREGDSSTFRSRGSKFLGDFVNSPPLLIQGNLDLDYETLSDSSQSQSYSAYLAAKKARTRGVLVVGGNAGALEFFRTTDGQEVFGYLPRTGLKNLGILGQQDYGSDANYHRYFVDGPTYETDAHIIPRGESAARWTNMVLSSMGSGGRSVSALVVPTDDPSAIVGADAVQWELRDDPDLGHVTADFRVGKVQGSGGGWYAFIGNGIHSPSGVGALLVVDLRTGAVVRRLYVPATATNGLMGVRLLRNAHQEVYAAYAGDLLGNLWRFDFRGPSPDDWQVGFSGQPVFKATDASGAPQPITAAPNVKVHPRKGHLVLFGTGKLLDESDLAVSQVQSLYGIWDDTEEGQSSVGQDSPFKSLWDAGRAGRQALQTQTVDRPIQVEGETQYVLTQNPVDWETQQGWVLDLTRASGERATYLGTQVGDSVTFTTTVPVANVEACRVAVGGAYNYFLNALTGGAIDDFSGPGSTIAGSIYATRADGRDTLLQSQEGLICNEDVGTCAPPTCSASELCPDGTGLVAIVNTDNQAVLRCVPCGKGPEVKTRKLIDRIWRPIVNPPK